LVIYFQKLKDFGFDPELFQSPDSFQISLPAPGGRLSS